MYIDCGTGDPLVECNRRLHESLVEAAVPHRYEEYDGGHDWESWNRRLHIGLRFLDRAVRPAMTTDRSC
jgi:enterochelin esterase-like enzyme